MSSRRLVPAAFLSAGLLTLLTLTACEQSGDSSSDEPAPPATAPAPDSESSAVESPPVETAVAAAETPRDAPVGAKRAPASRIATPSLARDRAAAADAPERPAVASTTRDRDPRLANSVPLVANTTDFVVTAEPVRLELGEIPTNDAKAGIVILTNTGDTPRTVIDCKTSCGCTTANCQKGKTLAPGETMEVEVKLSGGTQARKLNKTVTFIVSDQPPLRVAVSGQSISFVTVSPAQLDPEQHPDGKMVLRAVDDIPFRIISMYPPILDEFSADPSVEHEIFLDWETLKESGHRTTRLLFTLDHPKCSKVNGTLSRNALPAPASRSTSSGAPRTPASTARDFDRLLMDGQTEEVLAMIAEGKVSVGTVDTSGQTPLVKAARWGDPDVILALLDASADISQGDRIGKTPLMYACQSEVLEAVQILLDAGADLSARDQIGNTALCWASSFDNAAIVKELIAAGSDIEASGPMLGWTPLIWAALTGKSKSIELLIEAGANIEAADVLQGVTPLMHAVRTGGIDSVRAILDAGARLEPRNNEGKTALLIAASNSGADADVVQMLLDAGVDTAARSTAGLNALELAERRTDLRSEAVIDLLRSVIEESDEK